MQISAFALTGGSLIMVLLQTFARGMELRARQTLFAEGCRGSCSEQAIEKFKLREGKAMQTYGIGFKEVRG